ncbi:MAG: hypothetical protein WB795_08840 [Candidatus Acidiferrales bacterium]
MRLRAALPSLLLVASIAALAVSPAASSPSPPPPAPQTITALGSIILPPRVVAGQPATLAVLDATGRLVPGVPVDIGNGQVIRTDATGRAKFTVPPGNGPFLARITVGPGQAAAVVVPQSAASPVTIANVPPFVSLRDGFTIRGSGFQGDADANDVTVSGQHALVLAASPVALVLLPGPRIKPGEARIVINSKGNAVSAPLTVVSFEFDATTHPVRPGRRSKLEVRAVGTNHGLDLEVKNHTPNTLRFPDGDLQLVRTYGAEDNIADFTVEGIAPGDFSFSVKLIHRSGLPPDPDAAEQFLVEARRHATDKQQHHLDPLIARLQKHPKEARKIERGLQHYFSGPSQGQFGFWIDSAREALRGD